MNLFFSICSNNYLAQATVLGKSIQQFHPGTGFILFLCDQKISGIDYRSIADEVIEVEKIEPRFQELAHKYNIVELNTCVKPRIFEYLFAQKQYDQIVYLDPDIRVFHPLTGIFADFQSQNILLTPHIDTPVPLDGKKPGEEHFLIYGIYNLGFISIRPTEESDRFIEWWKERTYERGYIDTYKGIFVDQLPVNLAPLFFRNVLTLADPGMNMAPWNLHERWLSYRGPEIFVNESHPLKFYHFSSFTAGTTIALPLNNNTRFTLDSRPDLVPVYKIYNDELLSAGYEQFHRLQNAYRLPALKKKKGIRKFLP